MSGLSGVFSVIGRNLLGYDMLIFIFMACTLYCYLFARRLAAGLYKTLNHTVFMPEQVMGKAVITPLSEADLVEMRKRANSYYAVFVNLTGIFPLLGILGTVVSLIPMVSDMDNIQTNFFMALTSTFWGLVFAIIFKFLDGFLSARIEENASNIALYLERNQKKAGKETCETGA